MVTTIFTAAGWVLALAFTWVAVSSTVQVARHLMQKRLRLWNAPGWPFLPLAYSSAALATFTALGVFPVLRGALLAALPFTALAVVLGIDLAHADRPLQAALTLPRTLLPRLPRAGFTLIKRDIRAIRAWLRRQLHREDVPLPRPAPPAPAPAPGRTIPVPVSAASIHDDPDLGATPPAGEVADGLVIEGVPVPPHWAALCEAAGSFEPDNDDELIQHVAGEAAGILAYADARRNLAETLLHATGLDPAYVAGHFEFADEFADLAAAAAMVNKRFHAIYDALRAWIADHPEGMPHNARQWLATDSHDEDEAA
jgi:hypothetical protein